MVKDSAYRFRWQDLGDIEAGRPNLGSLMNVAVYRLMQYTLREVLNRSLSVDQAADILREAGTLAGTEFCRNLLDCSLPFPKFLAQLQAKLLALRIGVLRAEKTDFDRMELYLTVAEDLDCSGLPPTGGTVCEYDEGFLAGVLSVYTGRTCTAREIDCWASGERICRFKVTAGPSEPHD